MEQPISGELVAVEKRFERWRKRSGGGRGTRIPAELWGEAARVARVDGVYATARALRLNYESLKARVAAKEDDGASPRKAAQGFVEVEVGPSAVAGTVVELVGRRGDQVRIHLGGVRTTELVAIAEAFWSRQS